MASGTANSSGPVLVAGTSLQHEQMIELQLARTRRRIKWVDLGCLAMTLAGAVTLYLLLVVWIDHWVVDLGPWGRWLALLGLVLGVAYYCTALLVPPLLRRINPAYAARAIEQANPSLKNSLLNFLTFRRDDSPTARLVHQALRQRAAQDLQQVNLELAVDRTRLIRIGYTVVALMALAAVYTILSPKNAFQTLHRVAAPWAAVARPSRVSITDVQPGSVKLVYGSRPTVWARIAGVRNGETAQIRYSTLDRQTLDRGLPMHQADGESRFTGTVPAEPAGLQQDLIYWIEAGDARSLDYRLTVLPTPTILVDQITYNYPAYTGRSPRVIEREGVIEALEGTQVTIRAHTNHPIQDARIEFDLEAQPSADLPAAVSQPMTCQGQTATYSMTLRFKDPERSQPDHSSYRLTFTTLDGLRSDQSMVYRITVFRDLPPEVAILTPRETAVEVPANGRQRIEVRALDPDYGLARVVLHARTGGRKLLDQELLTDPAGRLGQELLNYDFTPRRWQLQPGDQVTYWVSADDNRTSPGTGEPDPNSQRTRDYTLTIVSPDPTLPEPTPAPGDADASRSDPTPAEAADGSAPPQGSDAGNQGQGADGSTGAPPPGGQSGGSDSGQSTSEDTSGGAAEDAGAQQSGESPSPAGPDGQQSSDGAGQSGAAAAGDATEQGGAQDAAAGDQTGSSGAGGTAGADGGQSAGQSDSAAAETGGGGESTDGEAADSAEQRGEGQGAGSSARPGARPGSAAGGTGSRQAGTPPDAGTAASVPDTQGAPDQEAADREGTAGRRPEPLHDGEAFERALEHFQQAFGQGAGRERPAPSHPSADRPPAGQELGGEGPAGRDSAGAASQETDTGAGTGGADRPEGAQTPDRPQPGSAAGEPGDADPTAPSSGERQRDRQGADGTAAEAAAQNHQPGDTTGAGAGEGADRRHDSASDDASDDASDGKPGATQDGSQERARPQPRGATDEGRAPSTGASPPTPDGSAPDGSAGDDSRPETGTGRQPGRTPQESPGGRPSEAAEPGPRPDGSPEGGSDAGEPADAESPAPADEGDAEGDATPAAGTPAAASGEQADRTRPNATDPGGRPSRGLPEDGGGQPSGDAEPADLAEPPAPVADAANLDYARRATDLVLERLRQEQADPDAELLESLGWTADDLRRFLARWEELKRAAREEGPSAQAELDDALRSLGLRPTAAGARRGTSPTDQQRGLRDAGRGVPPPPEYRDLFNAYKKGAARGSDLQGPHEP